MSTINTATLALVDGMAFAATTGSGHTITLDAKPEVGGRERGPRPIELLLLGLGGCTAMDVIAILRKMRQSVTNYRVEVMGERADEHPQVYTRLTVEHIITGAGLNEAAVRRAIELSNTRYCAAQAMLRPSAPIETRCRLIDTATGAEVDAMLEPALT